MLLGKIIFGRHKVDSTQNWIVDIINNSSLRGAVVCISDRQLRGRGRRGKDWMSDEGGIYLSFSLCFPEKDAYIIGFRLAVSVYRLISLIAKDFTVCIKWPNDILLENKKVAGILIEKIERDMWVCGIGINVYNRVLMKSATSLKDFGIKIAKQEVIFLLLDVINGVFELSFDEVYQEYVKNVWNIPGSWNVSIKGKLEEVFVYEVLPTGRVRTSRGDFDYLELLL